jgi:acyl-homoserine lactone acylase PvdQ
MKCPTSRESARQLAPRPRTQALASLAALLAALVGCSSEESPSAPAEKFPSEPVELIVDELGISHVYAKNDADAFYGAGYAMARDRLFHMELNRRQALGARPRSSARPRPRPISARGPWGSRASARPT